MEIVAKPQDGSTRAWLDGFVAVAIFSGSLPATRIAVSGFDPLFLTTARASIAGLLAVALLAMSRSPLPSRRDLHGLAVVAFGAVLGFPLLTALALRSIPSARSIVFIALLPLATAIFAVLRGGERPRAAFWLFSVGGSALVAGFALGAGAAGAFSGDLMMVGAVVVCGLAYAEGAVLARRLGGWQVISWALVLSLPMSLALLAIVWPANIASASVPSWIGLGYVSVFSMLIGFVFWYRGLAAGGAAAVGQLQLLQPFMGLVLAAALLGEAVSPAMIGVTLTVVGCVAMARRFARR